MPSTPKVILKSHETGKCPFCWYQRGAVVKILEKIFPRNADESIEYQCIYGHHWTEVKNENRAG